jgi:formylglycine-generating enzyme required for sulfatase activity
VHLTGQNTTDDFTMVEFDISWENSWRYNGGPNNWDAAWIFVKYRVGAGPWLHALLNDTGHQSPVTATIENGLLTPGAPFNSTTNPTIGVFLYRNTPGVGNISYPDVQLRWNYGANSVADDAQIDIRVFVVEMVYIPGGSFVVGSGGNEISAFYTYPTSTQPYSINSEAAIEVGTIPGNLYYNTSAHSGDQMGPVPAAYPKGYNAFYAMKYELSQSAYTDFLNTLTRAQQSSLVESDITGSTISNTYVLAGFNMPSFRNGIRCRTNVPPAPSPLDFFCDLNNNGIENEISDGRNIPCNYLRYAQQASYLDWAGLRLITEFEFEKCGRGPVAAFANEHAWGNQKLYYTSTLVNSGTPDEIAQENYANNCYLIGPIRNGAFAKSNSTRELSGGGYYGCMELSGNLWERGVSIGIIWGRNYTGQHGDGLISSNGDHNVPYWPTSSSADGLFWRGGAYATIEYNDRRLSDRTNGTFAYTSPVPMLGCRGVRTAQQ